jgi:four helix bundle protein
MGTARAPARSFEDLVAWQKAHQFVLSVYAWTAEFQSSETYGLTAQLRRAAISIPANIAEGFKRTGRADKARMLNIAQGSLEECRYYLILAADLKYGSNATRVPQLEEVSKILDAYSRAILNSDS